MKFRKKHKRQLKKLSFLYIFFINRHKVFFPTKMNANERNASQIKNLIIFFHPVLLVSNRLSLTPMMVVKRYNKCFGIYFVVSDILHRMYVRMAFVVNSLKPDEGPNIFLIEFRLMSKIFRVIFF